MSEPTTSAGGSGPEGGADAVAPGPAELGEGRQESTLASTKRRPRRRGKPTVVVRPSIVRYHLGGMEQARRLADLHLEQLGDRVTPELHEYVVEETSLFVYMRACLIALLPAEGRDGT